MDVLTVAWELRWHIAFVFGVLLLTFNIERKTIQQEGSREMIDWDDVSHWGGHVHESETGSWVPDRSRIEGGQG